MLYLILKYKYKILQINIDNLNSIIMLIIDFILKKELEYHKLIKLVYSVQKDASKKNFSIYNILCIRFY